MAKVKFETKQDYIDYCKVSEVGTYSRQYGSSYMSIEDGKSCAHILLGNNGYLDKEPLSYPCIMCYYEDNDGNFYGNFVYPNDFME